MQKHVSACLLKYHRRLSRRCRQKVRRAEEGRWVAQGGTLNFNVLFDVRLECLTQGNQETRSILQRHEAHFSKQRKMYHFLLKPGEL